jgi:hypothetical protein
MGCNSTGLRLDGLEKPVAVLNDVAGMYQQHGWGMTGTWNSHIFLDDVIFASQVNALLPKEAGEHL